MGGEKGRCRGDVWDDGRYGGVFSTGVGGRGALVCGNGKGGG